MEVLGLARLIASAHVTAKHAAMVVEALGALAARAAVIGARRAPHLAPLAKPVAAACRVARSLGLVPAQSR